MAKRRRSWKLGPMLPGFGKVKRKGRPRKYSTRAALFVADGLRCVVTRGSKGVRGANRLQCSKGGKRALGTVLKCYNSPSGATTKWTTTYCNLTGKGARHVAKRAVKHRVKHRKHKIKVKKTRKVSKRAHGRGNSWVFQGKRYYAM